MSLNPAMWAMMLIEVCLWSVLCALFRKKKLHKRFPTMGGYLVLRAFSTPLLFTELWIQSHPAAHLWYAAYFFTYWPTYIAGTVLLFFVSLEVFRSALVGFTGLQRFGTIIFYWAAAISVIVSLSTVNRTNPGMMLLGEISFKLMRAVSIIELCLLAFLCISMNALRLSVRDMSFGIALGFGVLSASDFITVSLLNWNSSLIDPVQFVGEAITLCVIGVWIAYAALPEKAQVPIVVSAGSTIYRWNEIASAFGHKGTNVAVQQPATTGFFLTDVEQVVEKVLARNLQESETKS